MSPIRIRDVEGVLAFLGAGTRTGHLGYLAADGRPLTTPVWFVVDDGRIRFATGRNTAKGRALRRDPRAVLSVDDPAPPYAFVQVQGIVEISDDPREVLAVTTACGRRYMGPDRAVEFGRRNADAEEMAFVLRPTRVVSSMDVTAPAGGPDCDQGADSRLVRRSTRVDLDRPVEVVEAEVAQLLRAHPAVAAASVTADDHRAPARSTTFTAVVRLRSGETANPRQFATLVQTADLTTPVRVELVDQCRPTPEEKP